MTDQPDPMDRCTCSHRAVSHIFHPKGRRECSVETAKDGKCECKSFKPAFLSVKEPTPLTEYPELSQQRTWEYFAGLLFAYYDDPALPRGSGVRVRQWGWRTFALNVDGCFKGTFATREDAERVGAYVAETVGNKRESANRERA